MQNRQLQNQARSFEQRLAAVENAARQVDRARQNENQTNGLPKFPIESIEDLKAFDEALTASDDLQESFVS